MMDAMLAARVPEPFPGAYDPTSYCLDGAGLRSLLEAAGLTDVAVELVELDAVWPDLETARATVFGTPFGPLVQSLEPATRAELLDDLAARLGASGDGPVAVSTAAHLATGRA